MVGTMRDSAKDIPCPSAILRFSPGGPARAEEYWHDEEGRIEPQDGWGVTEHALKERNAAHPGTRATMRTCRSASSRPPPR